MGGRNRRNTHQGTHDVLLRGVSPESRYPSGDGLSSRAQGPEGRICPVLHLGETAVRTGAHRGRSGGLHQRGFDPEDRAVGPGHGHREHLRRPSFGVQQGARKLMNVKYYSRRVASIRNVTEESVPCRGLSE